MGRNLHTRIYHYEKHKSIIAILRIASILWWLVPFPDGFVDTGKSPPTLDSRASGNDRQVKRISGIRYIQMETVLNQSQGGMCHLRGSAELRRESACLLGFLIPKWPSPLPGLIRFHCRRVPIIPKTCSTTRGAAWVAKPACRARQSRLLMWSDSTTPVMAPPCGRGTSKG